MFSRPVFFQEFLVRTGQIDEIYEALADGDTSEVVMRALHILRQPNILSPVSSSSKNDVMSRAHRIAGDDAYQRGFYQKALELYNQALLFAPAISKEIILAYSKRSELFFKLTLWTACNSDISRCFAIDCPRDIFEKLTKMKIQVSPYHMAELIENIEIERVEKFINIGSMTRHTSIPCASSDVAIDTSKAKHKVVASANISVGDTVASEEAYVSFTGIQNVSVSCHFCQKKALNLIPCEGCCYALFCDEECKKKCMREYHEYECKIMDVMRALCIGPKPNLMIKACLKLRSSCKTWKELIVASNNMGIERINSSSIQEIYDTNNKYSLLCSDDDKTFVYGALFNACFICAAILHYLDELVPSFLPRGSDEQQLAMRALARIMMFVYVYQKPSLIIQAQNNIIPNESDYGSENFGLFPFISKLRNVCDSNLLIANNNNTLVLIAVRPIKKGEELTVSYISHRYESKTDRQLLNRKQFSNLGTVCGCQRCNNDAIEMKNHQKLLPKLKMEYFSNLNVQDMDLRLESNELPRAYSTLSKALTVLLDAPNSKEYKEINTLFRKIVFLFEFVSSSNSILDSGELEPQVIAIPAVKP